METLSLQKKSVLKKTLVAFCLIIAAGVNVTYGQYYRKWVVYNKQVNVSLTNPTTSALPTTPTSSVVSNGVYNASGVLLFYVSDKNIYNASGTSISNIPWSVPVEQCPICRVPGTTDQYYVITVPTCPMCQTSLYYSKIQVTGTTATAVSGQQNIMFSGAHTYFEYVDLAVKLDYEDLPKYLYVMSEAGNFDKYTISNSGITYSQSYSNSFSGAFGEMDLSLDGTKLAVPAGSQVKMFNLDGCTGDVISSTVFTVSGAAKGTEFNDAGTHIFTCTSSGIYDITISSGSIATVSTTTSFGHSFLERGYNGKMYVASGSGLSSFVQTPPYSFSLNSVPFTNGMTYFGDYPLPCQNDFLNGIAGPNKSFVVCCPNPLSIGETAQGGCTYSWSPTTGLSNPNISPTMATPNSTTTYTLTRTCGGCVSIDQVKITTVDGPCCRMTADGREIDDDATVSIYPNPSTGFFTVENISEVNSVQRIEVMDLPGNVIYVSGNLNPGDSRGISLNQFSKGYYFCNVYNSDGRRQTFKLVII